MKKLHFDIQGMTCASCQAHVTKAVQKLDGTKNVHVNLLTNDMTLDIDENKLNEHIIVDAVKNAGYGAICTNQKTYMKNKVQESNEKAIKNMKTRLIVSLIFWIPLMYISMNHMFNMWFGLPIPTFIMDNFHGVHNSFKLIIVQFILVIPIILVNRAYFKNGFKTLLRLSPNMDSLIALGATASIVYGIVVAVFISQGLATNNYELVKTYSDQIYIESAGTILTLITIGKFLETKSKGKTGDAISKLINLAPKTAIVVRDGKEQVIPSEKIQIDDIIIVKPGSSIPVDGTIIEGSSSVDQSAITGESMPVLKEVSNEVISGTINKNGTIKIKATKVGAETTLSQIIKLVEEASTSKAPIENIADKVAAWFVPIVILICIITLAGWLIAGESLNFALTMAISVLVISCPCALGLATPVAIMVGTGKGAENGILIKSAESLQKMDSVKVVVFDKTGTITKGKPKVTDVVTNVDEKEFLSIAASIEHPSEHPLAEAIVSSAQEKNIEIKDVNNFESITGKGIKAKIGEKQYLAGNLKLMESFNINIENSFMNKSSELASKGKTIMYFADKINVIGLIAVSDTIKSDSKQAIMELKNRKIKTIMITGDNKLVANEIAKLTEIDEVYSEVLPNEKEQLVSKVQAKYNGNNNGGYVAFVGDGVNDSPALAKADVGLAIGSGTDIAIESADIVLVKNSLLDVVTTIDLSKKTMLNIKENLFWAFFYNAICIPIACGLLFKPYGIKLNPMLGSAAMSISSVCVVANALRLRLFKNKYNSMKSNNDQKKNITEDENIVNYKATTHNFINENKDFKEENIMKKEMIIEGMMCGNCAKHVTNALKEIEGVSNVQVNLENKTATIELTSEVSDEKLTEAVTEEGYKVIEIK